MIDLVKLLALVVAAVTLAAPLAHVLERPGKMRLARDAYFTVQSIYYPGFTIAGASEPLAVILVLTLIVSTPEGAGRSLLVVALLASVGMQVVYWLVTHPLNRVWLRGKSLSAAGSRFFSFARSNGRDEAIAADDWERLRNRWEYSHAVRAGLAGVTFAALAVGVCVV